MGWVAGMEGEKDRGFWMGLLAFQHLKNASGSHCVMLRLLDDGRPSPIAGITMAIACGNEIVFSLLPRNRRAGAIGTRVSIIPGPNGPSVAVDYQQGLLPLIVPLT